MLCPVFPEILYKIFLNQMNVWQYYVFSTEKEIVILQCEDTRAIFHSFRQCSTINSLCNIDWFKIDYSFYFFFSKTIWFTSPAKSILRWGKMYNPRIWKDLKPLVKLLYLWWQSAFKMTPKDPHVLVSWACLAPATLDQADTCVQWVLRLWQCECQD